MGLFRKDSSRDTFDPHELGARRSDPTIAALEPFPPAPRRTSTKRLMAYFVVGVIVVAVLRDGAGRGAPAVTGSCMSPAFALDKSEVRSYGVLKWSATGPADAHLVIGVDTLRVPTTFTEGKLAGPVALRDCKATGRFGMRAPEGDHVLTIFLVAADGSSRALATRKIVVDAQ